jgi:tetratricopeptide (TPR) repeat protein
LSAPVPFRYRAFLSYSHRDKAWCQWLHGALEGYRIDKDLVGRATAAGAVPKTLRPIFRDREDFSAGHSLNAQTQSALENSQFMIVICSPNSARSPYVNEEIRSFKALGRGDNVIPIIVDGEPGDGERECFPPALRFKVGPDGALTGEREEPIAADARPQGDGKEIAKLKLVAGLLGVGLDEIARRAERARRQRLRNWVAALCLLTLLFAGLAAYAELERRRAVATLNAATRTANNLINDLAVRFRTQMGVPAALVKDILGRAQNLQQELNASGQASPDLQHSEAVALFESALTLMAVGDQAGAYGAADRARQILESLSASNPKDTGLQLDLSVAYQRIGDALAVAGRRDDALAAFDKARVLDEALVAADPANEKAQDNLAVSHIKIGDVLGSAGKLDDALAAYRKAVAIRQALVARSGLNADWWRNLGASLERVGIALGSQGKLDEAAGAFQQRIAIAEELAGRMPNNTDYQRDISVGENQIGAIYLAQSKFDEALNAFQKSLATRQKLSASDQDNKGWLNDVAASYREIGRVQLVARNLDQSIAAYQQALAIAQKLVAQDRNNTQWLLGVCDLQLSIGLVLGLQDKLDDAESRFRESVAVSQAQVKSHPGDPGWQNLHQRGVRLLGRLANEHVLAGNFSKGLAIAEEAIGLAPDQTWLQASRAHALMFLGRTDEARAIYVQHRGQQNVLDRESWETHVLSVFADFRQHGLTHPLMDEIEKELKRD